MSLHPSDLLLQEFFRDPAEAPPRIQEHLRACDRCQKRLAAASDRETAPLRRLVIRSLGWHGTPSAYEPVFDRSERLVSERAEELARQKAEAPELLSQLLERAPEKQEALLRGDPRFATWGLFELLI